MTSIYPITDDTTVSAQIEPDVAERLAAIAAEPQNSPQDATGAPESDPEPDSERPDADEPSTPQGRSEAKLRKRAQTAEAERDILTTQLEAAQRNHVNALAESVGRVKPEALWAAGTSLAALIDDGGNVSAALVERACDEAASTLGLTRRPKPDPNQGRPPTGGPQDVFTAAFSAR